MDTTLFGLAMLAIGLALGWGLARRPDVPVIEMIDVRALESPYRVPPDIRYLEVTRQWSRFLKPGGGYLEVELKPGEAKRIVIDGVYVDVRRKLSEGGA